MIAVNKDYVSETPDKVRGDFLRDGRTNVLFYIDEWSFKENSEDSTTYVYNALRQLPEKYNVMLSYDRNPDARDADVVFSRFDPPTKNDEIQGQKAFLEELVQYEEGRKFYNLPSVQLAFRGKGYLERLAGSGLIPETIFTSSPHEAFTFIRELGEDIVMKPIFGYGANGVKGFGKWECGKAVDYLDDLLLDGQEKVIVQRFLPEIYTEGDKRVVLVDGEAIGARLRRPADGSILANIHAGGSAEDSIVTQRDRRVIERTKEYLPEVCEGWWGLDIIGEYLGEANVSSPGLAYAIDKANQNTRFIDAIKKSIERCRQLEAVA